MMKCPLSSVTLIAYSISILLASAAPTVGPAWKVWTIDPQPVSGSTSSCVFLPGGDVIVGFENRTRNQTRVARFDGKKWKTDAIVDTAAEGISVAVDSSGKIFLSSVDTRSRSLRLSIFDRGKWTSEVIDSKSRYMGPTSIVLTKSNDPRVFAYMLGANSLEIFSNKDGTWMPQIVTEPAGYEASGAISAQGVVACASMNGNLAMLSLSEGEQWNHHSFEGLGNLKGPNALDFNGDSLPAFVVPGRGNHGLKLATFSDRGLSTEFIEEGIPASSASIDYSAEGRPVVAYIDRSDLFKGLLKVATRTDGRWSIEIVDRSAGGGWQTCVAWGPNGDIGVSYYDQESRTLKFALKASLKKKAASESNSAGGP